jgi:hypothetical protein
VGHARWRSEHGHYSIAPIVTPGAGVFWVAWSGTNGDWLDPSARGIAPSWRRAEDAVFSRVPGALMLPSGGIAASHFAALRGLLTLPNGYA